MILCRAVNRDMLSDDERNIIVKPTIMSGIICVFLVSMLGCSGAFLSSGDTPRMTKEVLKSKIEADGENSPTVLDVRFEGQWERSEYKIKGAVRENPDDFESWADKYPKDKLLVLYCA